MDQRSHDPVPRKILRWDGNESITEESGLSDSSGGCHGVFDLTDGDLMKRVDTHFQVHHEGSESSTATSDYKFSVSLPDQLLDDFTAQNESLQDRLDSHLNMPPSPFSDNRSTDSLHERIGQHVEYVNPADEGSHQSDVPRSNLVDTPFRTVDGLEERIARHFQALHSASKSECSPSPSKGSTNTVNRNTKMVVSRALTFDGFLPECSPVRSPQEKEDDESEMSLPSQHHSQRMDCSFSPRSCGSSSDETDSSSKSSLDEMSSGTSEDSTGDEQSCVVENWVDLDNDTEESIRFDRSQKSLRNAHERNHIKLHAYTEKSVNEAIVDIMELHLKDRGSKLGLQRTIKTFSGLLPEDNNLPSSSYSILTYIKSLAPPISEGIHYYCQDCLYYKGTSISGRCDVCAHNNDDAENNDENIGNKFGHFLTFGIGATLKYFFECRSLASAIDAQLKRTVSPETFSDIQDGSVYKSMNANRGQYDVSLIMNSDGVRIRESSKKELWIVMFSVVEAPANSRGNFIIFAAIWYDEPKPKMNCFLRPLCEELVKLDCEGINWKHPNTGVIFNSKVKVSGGVLDAPARAMTQNVLLFNGVYGCNTCEIKTVKSTPVPNKKRVRIYPYRANVVLRTKERMETQAREAIENNLGHVMGVKGPSVLALIPSVDVSKFFIPEYMHSVLLGVVKQMLTIWTTLPGPWRIKHLLPGIDQYLAAVKHPDFVHKSPRVLSKMKFMKASDFYYFLLFEGLPVLCNRLPDRFFHHYLLLVKGIYLLLCSDVKETDIDEADRLLQLFVQQFAGLYTDRQLTSNMHNLCHLALVTRRYGPLSCNNAFIFENVNGLIARSTHGTQFVIKEILNNVRIAQGVQVLKNIVRGYSSVERWGLDSSSVTVLGERCKVNVSPQEAEVFGSATIFSRARIGSETFTSEIYKKLTSENFHVMFKDNTITKYAIIKYFAQTENNLYACLRLYKVDHTKVFYHPQTLCAISHLIPVEEDNIVVVKDVTKIAMVKVGKIMSFLFKRPNLLSGSVN